MPDRRYISSSDKGKRPLLDIREPPLSNAREQGRRDLRSTHEPKKPRNSAPDARLGAERVRRLSTEPSEIKHA